MPHTHGWIFCTSHTLTFQVLSSWVLDTLTVRTTSPGDTKGYCGPVEVRFELVFFTVVCAAMCAIVVFLAGLVNCLYMYVMYASSSRIVLCSLHQLDTRASPVHSLLMRTIAIFLPLSHFLPFDRVPRHFHRPHICS